MNQPEYYAARINRVRDWCNETIPHNARLDGHSWVANGYEYRAYYDPVHREMIFSVGCSSLFTIGQSDPSWYGSKFANTDGVWFQVYAEPRHLDQFLLHWSVWKHELLEAVHNCNIIDNFEA